MLRDLQARFGASLLAGFDAPPPDGLAAGDPARAAARFAIHRGNVIESLVNALGHTYPAVKALCGDGNFRVLAGRFVRAHPPAAPSLATYGAGFADFARTQGAPLRDFPFLPDLAGLEWAINEAYFAEEAPVLTPAALRRVPADALAALRLRLHATARLVASPHAIHTIWSALHETGTLPEDRRDDAEAVLVSRAQGLVAVYRLEPAETAFLAACTAGAASDAAPSDGTTLGEALAAAARATPGADIAATLASALTRGALAAFGESRPDAR